MRLTNNTHKSRIAGVISFTIAALALAGCSSSGEATPSDTASAAAAGTTNVDAPLYKEVPEEYHDGIKAAVLSAQAPLSWVDDDGNITGMFQDMLNAISEQIGVPINMEPNTFTNALAGVTASRYDMLPGTTVKKDRLEVLDFVSMYADGYTFATPEGGLKLGGDPMALCGQTIAGQTSDGSIEVLKGWSDECVAAGKDEIKVITYPSYADAQVTVQSGRNSVIALPISSFQTLSESDSGTKWEQTGFHFSSTIDAISFPKGSKLTGAIEKAMNNLIEDGTYEKIILKWMSKDNLITKSVVNPEPAKSQY